MFKAKVGSCTFFHNLHLLSALDHNVRTVVNSFAVENKVKLISVAISIVLKVGLRNIYLLHSGFEKVGMRS